MVGKARSIAQRGGALPMDATEGLVPTLVWTPALPKTVSPEFWQHRSPLQKYLHLKNFFTPASFLAIMCGHTKPVPPLGSQTPKLLEDLQQYQQQIEQSNSVRYLVCCRDIVRYIARSSDTVRYIICKNGEG